jgi:hypothetical protein
MATFDDSGRDALSYAPVTLFDAGDGEGQIHMMLPETGYTAALGGTGYPLNGHGIQGLIQAARLLAGLQVEPEGISYETEYDNCFVLFDDVADADTTAALLASALRDPERLRHLAAAAVENNLAQLDSDPAGDN